MQVKNLGSIFFRLRCNDYCKFICSDDNCTYPNQKNILSSTTIQNTNDSWNFVEPDHDQRPNVLPDFKEKSGPTFHISSNVSPATFYNEMLPDSLFDHIVTWTNTRARVYFDKMILSSPSQPKWKLVRSFL